VLARWQEGVRIEAALTDWARGARYAGSKDRRAVRDHVYDVLRQKGVCAALGGGETARALILGLARLSGVPQTLFDGSGYGPAALDPAEAQLFSQEVVVDHGLDTPPWLRAKLLNDHKDWPKIEAAFAVRAPLYLRVNTARTVVKDAQARLAGEGIATRGTDCATALEVTQGGTGLMASAAYLDGLVEPQDLSIQKACARVAWPDGPILDFCAGGGGKALAIAAATGRSVDVHDVDPRRMADVPKRAARAGAVLRVVERPRGPYALVLVDVPCSGSGTWRRDPEAKWRLTPERLAELFTVQSSILDQAARLSGRVIYMTCSLLSDENECQIEAFLARHSGWKCVQSELFKPLSASDGFYVAELSTSET